MRRREVLRSSLFCSSTFNDIEWHAWERQSEKNVSFFATFTLISLSWHYSAVKREIVGGVRNIGKWERVGPDYLSTKLIMGSAFVSNIGSVSFPRPLYFLYRFQMPPFFFPFLTYRFVTINPPIGIWVIRHISNMQWVCAERCDGSWKTFMSYWKTKCPCGQNCSHSNICQTYRDDVCRCFHMCVYFFCDSPRLMVNVETR